MNYELTTKKLDSLDPDKNIDDLQSWVLQETTSGKVTLKFGYGFTTNKDGKKHNPIHGKALPMSFEKAVKTIALFREWKAERNRRKSEDEEIDIFSEEFESKLKLDMELEANVPNPHFQIQQKELL